jgi:hypothetical protein
MYKTLELSDQSRRVIETNKNFRFDNNDSGSGVIAVKARSGSSFNYISSSDEITTITTGSSTTNYFSLPTWTFVNTRYYKFYNQEETIIPYRSFDIRNTAFQSRSLFISASVFSISRDLYGERIKPGSIKLSDTSNSQTFDIRDDGDGNLYDFAFSASYAAHKSSYFDMNQGIDANGSGSVIGNAFYNDGLIVVNQSGTYKDVGFGTGYTLRHQATHFINEHEYILKAPAGEFNMTSNISITKDRAGNVRVPATSSNDTDRSWVHNLFPPNHLPGGFGTGSFNMAGYTPASHSIDEITGSTWYPFVSQIGLYDIEGDLIAVAKPGQPIHLSPTLSTTFVVRFDT